jgi:hypothetical protein
MPAGAVQPTETTFRTQAAWCLSELASGRLKSQHKSKRGRRIRTTTLDTYRTAVVYLNEKIGDKSLAAFDNAEMKELISAREAEVKNNGDPRFTPKTIVNYHPIAAAVFATSKDRKASNFSRVSGTSITSACQQLIRGRKMHQQSRQQRSKRSYPLPKTAIVSSTLYWQGPDFVLPKR